MDSSELKAQMMIEHDCSKATTEDATGKARALSLAERSSGLQAAFAAGRRGMTIIEIMVVMAIIGIIGTAIAFGVMGAFDDAAAQGDAIRVDKVAKCLDLYRVKHREYPDRLETLLDGNCVKKEGDLKGLDYQVLSVRKFKLCVDGGEGKEPYCKE